ncbi:MAG: SDR family oxidoreductase [Bacteroidetes bacterium]|nr:SDR family oxidoreductase [Bacteroidota bacterium]MBS1975908.1 SDR family oxidoreductase [Bacteroidota bacterium]
MKAFQNKVAIVTGAGQGIGLEISRKLAAGGAHVLLNDIESSLAEEAVSSIRKEKGVCSPFIADCSDPAQTSAMVAEAVRQFGHVDIAIANAGITLYGDFFSYRPEDFDQVMRVNLRGSFFLAQAAAAQMKEQATSGSILFMSSVTGHQAHKNLTAYGMSKAALEMLAKTLVIELSPYKITVNAIAPGATLTERTSRDPDYDKTWSEITPMGRPATTVDVANAALFLVSPEAAHITGQTLVVDGGWTSVSPSPY